ncbi:unnamed protein product [Orchesella dallaii]|uniref:Ionotropic glutamate receptor C-terminal domain-containing protein n=1 Tax=Orchesella dallaii TaxID=48710 RepID=A0ABP1S7N6_9HEXA
MWSFNLSYLTLIPLIFVYGGLTRTTSILTSNSHFLSEILVKDINVIKHSLGSHFCNIQLISGQNLLDGFDLNILSALLGQEDTFLVRNHQDVGDISISKQTLQKPSFQTFSANCWINLIMIDSKGLKTLPKDLHRGSLHHYHIFVSESLSTLETFIEKHSILNNFLRKHGIFMDKSPSAPTYLIEPWPYSGQFEISTVLKTQSKVRNLNGRTLRVAFISRPAEISQHKDGTMQGSLYLLLLEIGVKGNVSFTYIQKPKTFGYGVPLKNGSWKGLLGEVTHGRVDISPLAISSKRFPHLWYTTSTHSKILGFIVRAPQRKREWNVLIKPLGRLTWILIVITFITVGILGYGVQLLSVIKKKKEPNGSLDALTLLGIYLEQSCNYPKGYLGRLLVFNWIIFSILIGTAYKSMLKSSLTFLQAPEVPSTFSELKTNPNYQLIMYSYGGAEVEIFRSSRSPIMRGIARRLKTTKDIGACVIAAATEEETACITWKNWLVFEAAQNPGISKAPLSISKDGGWMLYVSFGVRKESIFEVELSCFVGKAKAGGLMEKWDEDNRRVMIAKRKRKREVGMTKNGDKDGCGIGEDKDKDDEDEPHEPLSVNDLKVVFYSLLIGFGVSSFGLIGEFMRKDFEFE